MEGNWETYIQQWIETGWKKRRRKRKRRRHRSLPTKKSESLHGVQGYPKIAVSKFQSLFDCFPILEPIFLYIVCTVRVVDTHDFQFSVSSNKVSFLFV